MKETPVARRIGCRSISMLMWLTVVGLLLRGLFLALYPVPLFEREMGKFVTAQNNMPRVKINCRPIAQKHIPREADCTARGENGRGEDIVLLAYCRAKRSLRKEKTCLGHRLDDRPLTRKERG